MTPQQFIAKWQRVNALRAQRLPAALPRPVRAAGPAQAGRGRPRRHLVHLRARRAEDRRRQGLGRRLDARPLRLGVQGQAQGPQGGLHATAALPRGPGEPAAAGRLRHGPLRGPHQLHRHGQADPRLRPGRPGRPGQPRRPPQALHRARLAAARHHQREDHRRGGRAVRRTGRRDASEGDRAAAGRPLPDEAHVLHVRRGHRACCRRASSASCWTRPRPTPPCSPGVLETLFDAMADGGDFRQRRDPLVQRRPVRRHRRDPADHGRKSTPWPTSTPTTGPASSRRSSARSSSGPSTRASEAQIGAHYTSRQDIETLLEPVLLAPLRREWERGQAAVRGGALAEGGQGQPGAERQGRRQGLAASARRSTGRSSTSSSGWHHVTVLDPACGSGNFLYVAIHMLLDLEKEVIAYAADAGPVAGSAGESRAACTGWRSTPMPSSLPRW